jgi:hypothetical protein
VNALLDLADPEGDTITVQSSTFIGPVIAGLTGPPIPAPGQPLQLAWTGTVDPATLPGVYTWHLEFSDAANQSVVGCDIIFTVGDLPPVHIITGASAGAGTLGAPYECAFARGTGAATSIGLCLVTDPNAGQSASIAAQAALPGNPGAVGFAFVMAGPILRVSPSAMLTVAEAGQHLYEAQLTDGLNTVSIYVAILVTNPPMSFTTLAQLPDGETGTAYTQTLALSGATAPIAFTITTGALPDGLALDANTGTISGTPTQADSATFTIQATDSTGATALRAFTLEIATPPSPPPPSKPAKAGGCAAGAGGAALPLWFLLFMKRRNKHARRKSAV